MASEDEKDEMEQPAVDAEMNEEDMADAPSDEAAMDMPDWFKTELVNVSTGETFRIADFSGQGRPGRNHGDVVLELPETAAAGQSAARINGRT
jgi:hypothetical protein